MSRKDSKGLFANVLNQLDTSPDREGAKGRRLRIC